MSAPDNKIHILAGWRRAALWPLAAAIRLWGRSLRFEISAEDRARMETSGEAVAFLLWHNRLFLVPECYRRYRRGRPLYALISASGDGAWLSALFSLIGLRAVRGSSSRHGREAAAGLLDILRAGHDAGITPDGPRGPCYDFKPGALVVARRSRVPLILFGAEFGAARRLGSWDRFYLPLPFSRVRIRCERIAPAELAEGDGDAAAIGARLRALNPDR